MRWGMGYFEDRCTLEFLNYVWTNFNFDLRLSPLCITKIVTIEWFKLFITTSNIQTRPRMFYLARLKSFLKHWLHFWLTHFLSPDEAFFYVDYICKTTFLPSITLELIIYLCVLPTLYKRKFTLTSNLFSPSILAGSMKNIFLTPAHLCIFF